MTDQQNQPDEKVKRGNNPQVNEEEVSAEEEVQASPPQEGNPSPKKDPRHPKPAKGL